MKKKIYISFPVSSNRNVASVSFLREQLYSLGYDAQTVLDSEISGSSAVVTSFISDAIDRCNIFICFVDTSSPWLMFELGYAYAKDKKIILVGSKENLPSEFYNLTFVPNEERVIDILNHVESYILRDPEAFISISRSDPSESMKILMERPELIDEIDSREFESLVGSWFESKNFNVRYSPTSRDYGFDFLIEPFFGSTAIVQIKKYKNKTQVPLSVIRQVVGSMSFERVEFAIVISNARFSESSYYFTKDFGRTVFLLNIEDLCSISGSDPSAIEKDYFLGIYEKEKLEFI